MSDTKTKAKAAEKVDPADIGGERPYEGVRSAEGAEQTLTTDEELGGYPAYAGEPSDPVAAFPTPMETPGDPAHLIDPVTGDPAEPVYGGSLTEDADPKSSGA